jgi:hypothetical protein
MRLWQLASIGVVVLLSSFSLARASLVDASTAEAAYAKGDYSSARQLFETAAEQYRALSKNSQDFKAYREAAYLLDRLADCCFMQRDWEELKLNLDALYVVAVSEFNLMDSLSKSAQQSGMSQTDGRDLEKIRKEAQRYSTLIQLKRSIGLVLFDTKGEGAAGAGAIKQYQELVTTLRTVIGVENGIYSIDSNQLDLRLEKIMQIYDAMHQLVDLEALWDRYPLKSTNNNNAPPSKDGEAPPADDGAAPPAAPAGGK